MAFHEHLPHEITFQPFAEEQQQQLGQSRDMQQLLPLSGGVPTWLNNSNAATLRQQNFLHLQPESAATAALQNDDVRAMDRNRTESNSEADDLAEYKADILGHPLYDQLLSAHVSCLRIATPVDQLPRIDAQLQQSQRVVDKYSGLGNGNGNGVVDDKELDQFMTHYVILLCAFKEQLQQHVRVHAMEAVMACWELEQSLQSLTGVSPGEGTGATMSDDEEDQAESNANFYEGGMDGAESLSFGPLVPTETERSLMERVRQELKHELKQPPPHRHTATMSHHTTSTTHCSSHLHCTASMTHRLSHLHCTTSTMPKGYKDKIVDIREEILRKRRAGKLPGDTTSLLKAWWQSHSKWPYPTEEDKARLVQETGLQLKQINNWFINQRKRNWHTNPSSSSGSKSKRKSSGAGESSNQSFM